MNKEKLKQFCSKDETRYGMTRPFTYGDCTYATDGRIIVRVPKLGYPAPLNNKPTRKSVEFIFALDCCYREAALIPPLPAPIVVKCEDCGGVGLQEKCRNCNGQGDVECETCNHVSRCDDCRGSGLISGLIKSTEDNPNAIPCKECDGVGVYNKTQKVKVASCYFNADLLALIKDLPSLVFMVGDGPLTAAIFAFDCGEGRLMPMTHKEGDPL